MWKYDIGNGRASVYLIAEEVAVKEAFNCLRNLPINPLDEEWHGVVRICLIPSGVEKSVNNLDCNFAPPSMLAIEGPSDVEI